MRGVVVLSSDAPAAGLSMFTAPAAPLGRRFCGRTGLAPGAGARLRPTSDVIAAAGDT